MKAFLLTISLIFSMLLFSSFVNGQDGSTGKITGKITYNGTVKAQTIKAEGCGTVSDESIMVSKNGGLANVFVHITANVPVSSQRSTGKATIQVKDCQMSPRVVGVMVGQSVNFKNSDGILYNVHGLPKVNKGFNIGMPPTVTKRTSSFSSPEGPFQVKCDVHPLAFSYVAVMTHPYFAVTDGEGRFSIGNLPDGNYEIEAWHEKLGVRKGKVVVKGGTADLSLRY